MIAVHPFQPLNAEEIVKASSISRTAFPGQHLNFRAITLQEPLKALMVPWLEAQHQKVPGPDRPPREARIQVIAHDGKGPGRLYDVLVNLDDSVVVKKDHMVGKHSFIDASYMKSVEEACRADPRIQKEIENLDLPAGATVCIEPWAYATDGENDMSERTTMCWFYMRLLGDPDANYYAYPLELCAEVSEQLQVTKIYHLPTSADGETSEQGRPYDHGKVHDTAASEYHPSLRPPPRSTTKPLHIVQPDGPSFTTRGNFLSWEGWTLHVGFNYREGLTLHDVRHSGRSIFYRLSLAEMFVPYADPRRPYPRKAAFDLGNDGAGLNANNLALGCDCLGSIRYFSAWHNTGAGEALEMRNVVCCHEQDDGILWKHTNFRTGNAVVTRARVLVLQTVVTVSNYEYVFAFYFSQDASIHYEVRATGILSTAPIALGETLPYGTTVAPGVMAPYHQHLFCLRIDPAVDGHKNTLQVEETQSLPVNDGTVRNPYSMGFTTVTTNVEHECGLDLDVSKNRVFKIVNEHQVNPVTHTPVGFRLYPSPAQMLLAHADSFHARRSEFARHAVWVTRYDDEELFPAGRYTMQSSGNGGDGIASAIARRRGLDGSGQASSVRNEDIVVWHTFGSTHIPRVEDWPVMPCEKMTVGLKPVNFFMRNPGLDVEVSTQERNKSVLVVEDQSATCAC